MLSVYAALALLASQVSAQAFPAKRGLAWPWYNSPLDSSFFTAAGSVVAIYDWETYAPPSTTGDGGLNFIGTQATLDSASSPIGELASRAAEQGWDTVFTLNEPDINGISPADAASWYQTNINPLPIKKAYPAISSSTSGGQGLDWLHQFITACAGSCDGDYLNLHWYGGSFEEFQTYIIEAHAQFPDWKIVISEFALINPAGGSTAQEALFSHAIPFLDSADFVELYFPFIATSPALFAANDPAGAAFVGTGSCLYNDDGEPSSVGNLFY